MPGSPDQLATTPAGIVGMPIKKMSAGSLTQTVDPVVIEEPLEIRLQYGPAAARQEQTLAVTMRTPGHDEELALGWLFTEGIIPAGAIIPAENAESTPSTITIFLPGSTHPDLTRSQRHSFTSSSCGVCGKTSLESLHIATPENPDTTLTIPAHLLYSLPALLREGQDIFEATGGLHAAGLFDREGRLIALREDIGRHNALDKLIGHALRQRIFPLTEYILLLSGRACFELIQKAAMAGIRIIAAVGPPSSLAIQLAEDAGITLVGFLRQQRFNIYTGAHRIHI